MIAFKDLFVTVEASVSLSFNCSLVYLIIISQRHQSLTEVEFFAVVATGLFIVFSEPSVSDAEIANIAFLLRLGLSGAGRRGRLMLDRQLLHRAKLALMGIWACFLII